MSVDVASQRLLCSLGVLRSWGPDILILKWKGEAVWRTTSMPGVLTTSSKAPSWAMSGTMTVSSLSLPRLEWASWIFCALSWERTVVTTEWPRERSVSRT